VQHELKEGSAAPRFSLARDDGTVVTLDSYAGRKLVLYFYPRDDTAGCTREAIEFNAARQAFADAGAAILGVSADSAESHEKFKRKHGLSIPLASDLDQSILEAYGVWREKSMYGRKFMGIERSTFLIDQSGHIAKIWRKVKLDGHVAAVLSACQTLD